MKSLATAAREYLALRRTLGFKLRHETWWLPDFVAYMRSHRSSVITTALALGWAQQPPDADPSWWAKKLAAIRCFARHHHASDPRTEIPPPDLLPYQRRRLTPHLYTDEEVTAVLQQARRLRNPLLSATYTTLLGLLVATGLRVSEAIGLDQDDIDYRESLLIVSRSKFGKSRHVPLHHSTLRALHDYAQVRDRLCPRRRSRSFFVSGAGTRVLHQNFHHAFLRLLKLCAIDGQGSRRPRLHDLRHCAGPRIMPGGAFRVRPTRLSA